MCAHADFQPLKGERWYSHSVLKLLLVWKSIATQIQRENQGKTVSPQILCMLI